MNQLDWIADTLAAEGLPVPTEFEAITKRGKRHQPPFYLLDKGDGAAEMASMRQQFPGRQVIAFARRQDYDGVVCVVLADPVFDRGHVVILHDDAPPGCEIDDEFASLTAWAKAAEEEIDERVRMGWNESIKDLLD